MYFTELQQIIQKFIKNFERPWKATTIFKKKNKVEGITLSDINLYCKAIGIKTV